MSARLYSQNAVIVARQFNPTVVSDRWLFRHDIVRDEEMSDGSFFTPPAARIATTLFDLLALNDRLQLTPKPDHRDVAIERVVAIVSLLRHTPYAAVGVNLHWLVEMSPDAVADYSRRTFFVADTPFGNAVQGEAALFGGLVFMSALGGRVRVDVRPTSALDDIEITETGLLARVNYHFEVPEDIEPSEFVIDSLRRWGDMEAHSRQIVDSLGK
jgi:hypothetical protein